MFLQYSNICSWEDFPDLGSSYLSMSHNCLRTGISISCRGYLQVAMALVEVPGGQMTMFAITGESIAEVPM
eukprot:scaffold75006_cov34-Prasinocladus_malaysianus.AAC.1